MYIYILSYLWLLIFIFSFFALPSNRQEIKKAQVFFFLGFIPTLLLITLRGDVGTDTWNYLKMATEMIQDRSISYKKYDIEIGFFILLKFLTSLFNDPRFIINFISFSIASYAFILFSKTTKLILIFAILIAPIFLLDMSMNGLRYGLAFLLAKHASDKYDSNQKLSALLLVILSTSVQLSGLLVFILLVAKHLKPSKFIYLVPFALIFCIIFQDRLIYKYYAYQTLIAPDLLSGSVPLLVFLGCYLSLMVANKEFGRKFLPLLLGEIAAFLLAKISYAGLRFQLLILFVFFCQIAKEELETLTRKNLVLACFLIIGLIGFYGKLRNFSDGANIPLTPFLPYHFYWDAE